MKIFLSALLILLAVPAFATDYYGCAAGQNVHSDALWCTYANLEDVTPAACTQKSGGSFTAAATVLQAGNNLYANGCTIVIDDSFTAGKISTRDAGAGANDFSGGSFTFSNTSIASKTFTTAIEGGPSSSGILITGSGSNTNNITGAITGGTAATYYGINAQHTAGTIVVTGSVTGGTNATAYGIYNQGSSVVNVTGNVTGATAIGYLDIAAANSTVTGDCIGSATANVVGCSKSNTTYANTVTGNIVASANAPGTAGKYIWAPSAITKYLSIYKGTGTYYYMTPNPDPAVANVKKGVTYGWDGSAVYTGTYGGSGGGAWGF